MTTRAPSNIVGSSGPHKARLFSYILTPFLFLLILSPLAEAQLIDYPDGASPDNAIVGEIIELSVSVRNLGPDALSDVWLNLEIQRLNGTKVEDTHTDYTTGLIYWSEQGSQISGNETVTFTARYCLGTSSTGHLYLPVQYSLKYAAWRGQPGSPGAEQIGELQSEVLVVTAIPTAIVTIPILEYHRIYDTPENEYWVQTEEFEAQMKALVAYGYEPVTTQDIYDYNYRGGTLPAKPVVITFDDGYDNLYTRAYPILMRLGLFGEAYIITDYIGFLPVSRQSVRLYDSDSRPYPHVIWPEIIEMAANGMVFGSHTKTHRDLTTLTDEEVEAELRDSKQALLDYGGVGATSFSYPYGAGHEDARLQQFLARFDYTTAVAAWGGLEYTDWARPFDLQRIYVYGPHPGEDPTSNGVSVNFDPAHPADFFMSWLDPDFPVPLITIDSVEFLDQAGNPRSVFYPSQLVRVRVHARNSGPSNRVTVTLKIDIDEGAEPLLYDSHQAAQDISRYFAPTGETAETFEFLWRVPADAPAGDYDVSLEFHDSTFTLGFMSSGWIGGAFKVCEKMHLLSPTDNANILAPPTFTWGPGCNDKFAVEFSASPTFSTPKRTPILSTPAFAVPVSVWNTVPSARRIYWRVLGADSSAQPISINKSQEVWSFFKN